MPVPLRTIQRRLVAAAAAAALAAAGPADAQLVTFDDLPLCAETPQPSGTVPAGHAGFSWDGFRYANGAGLADVTAGPGYANGVVSPHCMSLLGDVGYGDVIGWISAPAPFTFNGGYFTAAFEELFFVQVVGYKGGVPFYGIDIFSLGTESPFFLDVNWTNLSDVSIQVFGDFGSRQLVMDDLRFNNASVVPEPSSVALLAGGLLGIGALVRRRGALGGRGGRA